MSKERSKKKKKNDTISKMPFTQLTANDYLRVLPAFTFFCKVITNHDYKRESKVVILYVYASFCACMCVRIHMYMYSPPKLHRIQSISLQVSKSIYLGEGRVYFTVEFEEIGQAGTWKLN